MAGRRGLTCGLMALIAFMAVATTAEAEFDAVDVRAAKVREKSFTPDGVEPVGGSVTCKNDGRPVAGGAFWREPPKTTPIKPGAVGFPTLTASLPTSEFDGWYAHGVSTQGETLTVRVLCSSSDHLHSYFMLGGTLNTDDGDPAGGTETCDTGDRAFSGGSSWLSNFSGPELDDASLGLLASNVPGENRRSWYSDGLDIMDGDPVDAHFGREVRCLPNKQLGKTVVRSGSTSASAGEEAAAKAKCQGRERTLAGGALWHTGGGDPNIFTNAGISGGGSVVTKDRRGWYAHGLNGTAGFRTLTVRVLCVK